MIIFHGFFLPGVLLWSESDLRFYLLSIEAIPLMSRYVYIDRLVQDVHILFNAFMLCEPRPIE